MKVENHSITLGVSALLFGGFILKFLWFALGFIFVWGLAKITAEYVPLIKRLGKHLKLDLIDKCFDLFLSFLYRRLPEFLYYAFLLRVPIISGLILFLFPLAAQLSLVKNFLQNLFVIEFGQQLIIVMLLTTLTASFIISLLKTILVLTDEKLNRNIYLRSIRSGLTIVLVSPTLIVLLLNKESSINLYYGCAGLLLSLLIFLLFQIYEYREFIKEEKPPILNKVIPILDAIEKIQESPSNKKLAYRFQYFAVQILIGLSIYTIAIFVNWPQLAGQIISKEWQAPTLLYVLLIIWVLTLFAGIVTFVFDNSINKKTKNLGDDTSKISNLYKYPFYWPVILFLIIFSVLGYKTANVDHFFKLLNSQVGSYEVITNYEQDRQKAIWNRLCNEKFDDSKAQICNNNKAQSLVVVAASGGGIQASGWMAQVLAGLQNKQQGIGEDFTKAIALISSASGGSVGSMFYLDQFENGVLSPNALQKGRVGLVKVVENATDDWLNAVGWGLAFPDLSRVIGLPCVLNLFSQDAKYLDRGYAIEKTWQKTLGKEVPTLDSRRKKILEGKIPISVYNTTLVENGRPFLVSPMKFVPGTMADYASESSNKKNLTNALDFKTLYNNCGANGDQACDLALTTAARLSASFPYVMPMARNDRENYIKNEKGQTLKVKDKNGKESDFLQNYHIADGGYYDNAGAFTSLQWLNTFLKYNNDHRDSDHYINIKKVLILQISAFPEDDLQLDQQGRKGLEVVTIGPVNTLAGIRDSTQIARNHTFAQLLNDRWRDIEINSFTISFPKFKEVNGEKVPYEPPLSWRLTGNQKMNLEEAWQKDSAIRETVKEMKMFWLKI